MAGNAVNAGIAQRKNSSGMAVALQGLFHAGWQLHKVVRPGRMPAFLLLVTSDAEQIAVLLQRRILYFGCRFSIRHLLMALQAGFVIENTLLRDHQLMRVRLLEARPLMAGKAYRIAGRLMLPQKIDIKNSPEHIFMHLRLNIMTGEAGEFSVCQGPACGYDALSSAPAPQYSPDAPRSGLQSRGRDTGCTGH